jgi:hypothetical protein
VTCEAKDMAEFFRLALLCGAADHREARTWADKVIAASAVPPSWAIELSLAPDTADFVGMLGSVPGQTSGHLPGQMLLGRLFHLRQRGKVIDRALTRRLYSLLDEGDLPSELYHEILRVDDAFDLAAAGIWSTQDAEHALEALLSKFKEYDPSRSGAA